MHYKSGYPNRYWPQADSTSKWFYTLWNYTSEDQSDILNPYVVYHVYAQRVSPTTNKPFIQGFIILKDKKTYVELNKILEANYEPLKGTYKQSDLVYQKREKYGEKCIHG